MPPELPPPPHEQINKSTTNGKHRDTRARNGPFLDEGGSTIPISTSAQTQRKGTSNFGIPAAIVRAVVLTLTANGEAVLALTLTLAGKVHIAPVGAPVQLRVAVPAKPAPPMESAYLAVWPARTVADELPEVVRPKDTPVPVNATVCGLPSALSATLTSPVRSPAAVGVNFTVIWHESPAAREVEQVLVSAKSPEAEICVMFRGKEPVLVKVMV